MHLRVFVILGNVHLYVTFRLHDDFHVKSLKVKCEMSRDMIISTPSFPDGCLIVVGVFR